MAEFLGQNNLWPFSSLPASLADKYGISLIHLRPFGVVAEDLDIEFMGTPSPHLTSDILMRCVRSGNNQTQRDLVLDLPVSSRLQGLLVLATKGGRFNIDMSVVCLNPRCRKMMDIDFTLEELSNIQGPLDKEPKVDIKCDGFRIHMRKPTGRDQQNWLNRDFASKKEAQLAMIEDLSQCSGEDCKALIEQISTNTAIMKAIEDAMNEADPIINPIYNIVCPECNNSGRYVIDLEKWALGRLRKFQNELVSAIHLLASAYHWSENEILGLPSWRRAMYLKLLERERMV